MTADVAAPYPKSSIHHPSYEAPPNCHTVSQVPFSCGLYQAIRSMHLPRQLTVEPGLYPGGKVHWCSGDYFGTGVMQEQGHFFSMYSHLQDVVHSQQTGFLQIGRVHRQAILHTPDTNLSLHWALQPYTVPCNPTEPCLSIRERLHGHPILSHEGALRSRVDDHTVWPPIQSTIHLNCPGCGVETVYIV
ncbi:hypothetical protein E2C01_097779 [Portunus trituberculatus]|uniref:Uncharacterized protein n=1 Tax=Portunus trituberculatus TaxID=210409 RepID=A0A5B7JW33_PORTR|nr:hypothetical protein [Portunus trituberculatus]